MLRPTTSFAVYSTVGLEFAVSVLVGLFAGRWADGKLGTGGGLALFGFLFGTLVGFRSIWRAAQRMQRDLEREDDQKRPPRDD